MTARCFDFGLPAAQLEQALDGADRLFLMRPPAIADVETTLFHSSTPPTRLGLRQIVFLSLQGVQTNRGTPHYAVEQYLRRTGSPYTFLRPNFFMQNLATAYAADILGVAAGGRYARAETATIRAHIIHTPARVSTSARHQHLHLPTRWPWITSWQRLWTAIMTT